MITETPVNPFVHFVSITAIVLATAGLARVQNPRTNIVIVWRGKG